MTDPAVGPMSEETRLRQAADQAYRIGEGEQPAIAGSGSRLLALLSNATREAPLQALAIAFILGAMLARRRG